MENNTQSSRIFVRNLPPSLKDADFQKHFAKAGAVTDVKLIPHRRIGYVGYKTAEVAAHAVKYFHRTFIRMSKINVEIARSFKDMGNEKDAGDEVRRLRDERNEGNGRKRKRGESADLAKGEESDAKLNEFLEVMQPGAQKKTWANEDAALLTATKEQAQAVKLDLPEGQSDDEYEEVSKRQKSKRKLEDSKSAGSGGRNPSEPVPNVKAIGSADKLLVEQVSLHNGENGPLQSQDNQQQCMHDDTQGADGVKTDMDWLRSRTSRLLGLDDAGSSEEGSNAEDPQDRQHVKGQTVTSQITTAQADKDSSGLARAASDASSQTDNDLHEQPLKETAKHVVSPEENSGRLFVRNLSYEATEEDLWKHFSQFGALDEVHLPRDGRRSSSKGFAYVQFTDSAAADRALASADGRPFQGRLLHIISAAPKRDNALDEYALSKLPHKRQQLLRRRAEAASSVFQWNTMFMNPDAVLASTAEKLGVSKSEILDPTSSGAAVKQAHAESNVLRETKSFFESNGVELESFRRKGYSETAILIKNFSYGTSTEELRRLFGIYGSLKRLLMPPTGTMAIVEFEEAHEAKRAFGALSYRKLGDTILFLEKAPKDVFTGGKRSMQGETHGQENGVSSTPGDLLDADLQEQPSSTLFVRNLNFVTTTANLHDLFLPLKGFLSARVKTKSDPKKPGQVLSMGFGFVEFRSKEDAQAATGALNGYNLDGHKLQIRASHRAVDAAEERQRDDNAKKAAGRYTKIIIKNLPFEATKRDVRELFSPYGKLRSVRVPKKFDSSTRGFAFGEFITPKEAQNAMDALSGAHLLGRRLNLEFAAADAVNPEEEIEKMSRKIGKQANKVAAQELARSSQRKKFNVHQDEDGLDD